MNIREQALLELVTETLRPYGNELIGKGWNPQMVVLAPTELERIPGYKVALVVPLERVVPEGPG